MPEVGLIYEAMIAILQDVKAISKDKKNVSQGYKFRGIDDVVNVLHPIFAKHEVFVTSEVLQKDYTDSGRTEKGHTIYHHFTIIQYTFHAKDGSSVSATATGEGADSGDKGLNKCMSAAYKYVLMQTFMIQTEDEKDPDGETVEEVKHEGTAVIRPAQTRNEPDPVPPGDMTGGLGFSDKSKDGSKVEMVSVKQLSLMRTWEKELGMSEEQTLALIKVRYQVENRELLNKHQANDFINEYLKKKRDEKKPAEAKKPSDTDDPPY